MLSLLGCSTYLLLYISCTFSLIEFWPIVFSVWGVGMDRPLLREYQTQPSFDTHLLTASQSLEGSQMSGGKKWALDASPDCSWVAEPTSALSQACMHPPQSALRCSLKIFKVSLHLFPNSETLCSHFMQKSCIRYGRAHINASLRHSGLMWTAVTVRAPAWGQ